MRFCFGLIGCWVLCLAAAAGAGLDEFSGRVTWVVRADRRTGRLVRVALVSPAGQSSPARDAHIARSVEDAAREHQIDPLLVHSVIQAESSYNPFAVSPKGAQGLMQLMPSTARRFGVRNSFNSAENIEGGVRYLRYLLDLFRDEKLAMAAYNAGEQAVIRYQGIPPYAETRNYVRAVSRSYATAKQAAGASAAAPQEPVRTAGPVYRPIEQFIDEQGNTVIRTR
jgi:soluble lytic murein transglycosylase-like protein